jgi:putative colanic acid biosynthesis glycosyltransferase WcaI
MSNAAPVTLLPEPSPAGPEVGPRLEILVFSSYYWPETSGNAPYVTGVAEHLASEGHRVRVVTGFPHYPEWRSTSQGALARGESRNGVDIHRRWHYVPRAQSALTRAVYEVSLGAAGLTGLPRQAPDLILAVSPTLAALTLARTAAALYRRPYGLVFQDLQGPGAEQSGVSGGARIARVVEHAELAGARHAAAVGIIAEGFRSYFVDHGVDPERIHRLRNWSQWPEPTESVEAARARLGWGDDFICLHAGNMGHKQGLENVLDAAAALRDPSVRIVLAGNGNAHDALVRRAHELGVANVTFLPPQPAGQYEAMLRAADVLLVNQRASVGEMSLASKLTSYFAAGRPVVGAVAQQSETARELELAGAGLIVEPENPAALAEALTWTRTHTAETEAYGLRGHSYSDAHLSIGSVMRGYDEFVEAIRTNGAPARIRREPSAPAPSTPRSVPPRPAAAPALAAAGRIPSISPLSDPAVALSCVIVTYQSLPTLDDCLRSLEAEREHVALETIVVDNASSDGTVEMIEERYPWVTVVAERTNTGFARAANRAIAQSRGRRILLLNPDTIISPGALEATLAELERNPDVGVLGCKLVKPDGTFDHACKRGLPTVSSALFYVLALHRLFPGSRRIAAYTAGQLGEDEAGIVDAVNGAFMLLRREAAAEVGGLDERFWLYGEDLDWCQRFGEKGWRVLYWPAVKVLHVKGASGRRGRSHRTNFAFHRSMWLYFDKHLAPRHSDAVRAVVWAGIWARFVSAVAANTLRAAIRDTLPRSAPESGR